LRAIGRFPRFGADFRAIVPERTKPLAQGVLSVNKSDLVDALASKTKMSKAEAGRTIDALFSTSGVIAGELKKKGKVQITGFGNFETRKRGQRKGRNPRTGKEITIKASVAPVFRAGKGLKDVVNKK
jgi:DNA-binding protein HU-beta